MRFSLAWIPTTQFFVNEREAKRTLLRTPTIQIDHDLTIREQTNALQNVLDNDRLEHVELKHMLGHRPSQLAALRLTSNWPFEPAMLTTVWFPITWAATMVMASHCVGLTLPGIILLPGSFSGSWSSPKPQRGPEPRYRISLAIFIKETATVLSAPCASTSASCDASASNCESGGVRWDLGSSARGLRTLPY